MSDDPLQVCPNCQGKLTKVIYPTGVIFKGSGFYSTDYKASDKPETKSDPKPESKSESSD